MKFTHIPALASILLIAGCNRPVTDEGATGVGAPSETERSSGSQPSPTEPAARPPEAPPPADTDTTDRTPSTGQTPAAKPDETSPPTVPEPSDASVTPGDQSETDADIEVTRRVRQALTENNQLSATAQNIQIITANGKVTLRGSVNSATEQEQIAKAVEGIEGVTSVENQLEVKASP